jgi:hypothetical protein
VQILSIRQDASLRGCRSGEEDNQRRTGWPRHNDAVFEYACRFIVMKSLPGWIDEICTEHLQSVQPVSVPGDQASLTGVPK